MGCRKKKRILIVDDHPIVRKGMARLINDQADLEVCGEAGAVPEAMRIFAGEKPDLVVADISLNGANGIELIRKIRSDQQTPILVLSMHEENLYAERVLRAGANGYVMKQEATETLLTAIYKVLAGEIYVSSKMMTQVLQSYLAQPANKQQSGGLSDRELEVLEQIGRGASVAGISAVLCISTKTVETHRSHIKEKLHLANNNELSRYAMKWLEDNGKNL